jgi:hypothetical protein
LTSSLHSLGVDKEMESWFVFTSERFLRRWQVHCSTLAKGFYGDLLGSLGSANSFGKCDQVQKLEHVQTVAGDILVEPIANKIFLRYLFSFLKLLSWNRGIKIFYKD